MNRRFFLSSLTLVLLLSACGAPGSRSLTLSEEDAGKTIEMVTGETLTIALQGNPTTGYLWEVESGDAKLLKQVGEGEFEPDSDAVGSGGKVSLQFEAAAPGEMHLRLVYHRPWEQGVPPEKTFEVTIVVK
jgi:inhibitor of cysteine peptidase